MAELGIPTRGSAGSFMSIQDLDTRKGIYVTPTLRGLRAQSFRILRPSHLRPFWALSRALASSRRILHEEGFGELTVREALSLLPRITDEAWDILVCVMCLLSSMSAEEVLEPGIGSNSLRPRRSVCAAAPQAANHRSTRPPSNATPRVVL